MKWVSRAIFFLPEAARRWIVLDIPRLRNQSNRAKSIIHWCCILITVIAALRAKQQFIFLHRKNLDSLECIPLQLDHNASRACNPNAWHVLQVLSRTSLLLVIYKFLEMVFLGSLPNILGAKAWQSYPLVQLYVACSSLWGFPEHQTFRALFSPCRSFSHWMIKAMGLSSR